jgi:hypothetical protein
VENASPATPVDFVVMQYVDQLDIETHLHTEDGQFPRQAVRLKIVREAAEQIGIDTDGTPRICLTLFDGVLTVTLWNDDEEQMRLDWHEKEKRWVSA